ncbi:MAG: zinc ribbon-containing protein [Gammaproteobacteria bacterium]|nr:zinc ribbon-containing protein [Gammaproteobacteria bacterium]
MNATVRHKTVEQVGKSSAPPPAVEQTETEVEGPSPQEELAAYAKLRQQLHATLVDARDAAGGQAVSHAIEQAGTRLRTLGEYSHETINKLTQTLKKDLVSTNEAMRPKLEALAGDAQKLKLVLRERGGPLWHEMLQEGGHIMKVSRDKGGALVAQLAHAVGEWGQVLGDKLDESLVYHTGEVTHGGRFQCTDCPETIELKKPGHLPPCPKCHGSQYRRA